MPPLDGNTARAHPVSRGAEPAPRDESSSPEGTAKRCPSPDDSALLEMFDVFAQRASQGALAKEYHFGYPRFHDLCGRGIVRDPQDPQSNLQRRPWKNPMSPSSRPSCCSISPSCGLSRCVADASGAGRSASSAGGRVTLAQESRCRDDSARTGSSAGSRPTPGQGLRSRSVHRSVPLDPFRAGAAHVMQLRPVTRRDEPAHYSPNKP
jgi:hypothetical protein